jgi:hypothetical protein
MSNGPTPADEPKERLFRDDAGAALERVARLEEENARLREEVERLERSRVEVLTFRPRPVSAVSSVSLMGLTASGALLGMALAVAVSSRSARRPAPPPPTPTPMSIATYVPVPPTPIVYSPPRSMAAPPAEAEEPCAVSYVYGAGGVKRYKTECLGQ